ncbi:MAG: alcohol dehydrogenase, partial [Deltaproteobacteria bacterium]|nr:alcohol dehydrogenase [Deltaproteobacteria bacterium]
YASPPADTLAALDLIESKRVTVTDMITHRLPLGEAQLGFRLVSAATASLKVIIEPQR